MIFLSHYNSPLGLMTLAVEHEALVGLWFDGQKYFAQSIGNEECCLLDTMSSKESCPLENVGSKENHLLETKVIVQTKRWLDDYFIGHKTMMMPPLAYHKATPFQRMVWDILQTIPYGQTMTYGEIAQIIARQTGKGCMSAQAVGGAVGHNPISVIIPCHRIVGADGSLTGYAGGIERKIRLLELEGIILPQ